MEIEYWNLRAASAVALSVHLYNDTGVLIFCVGPPQHEEVFGGRCIAARSVMRPVRGTG